MHDPHFVGARSCLGQPPQDHLKRFGLTDDSYPDSPAVFRGLSCRFSCFFAVFAPPRHETAPTQFAEAGGIRIAYRRFGRRGGAPLLLLGYFTANLDRWDPKVTNGFAADRE
jgi:hypothetical protein